MKRLFSASLLAAGLALGGAAHAAQPLLNVSYDVMRDFYREYNPAFQKYWKAEKGENITIQMSHGGSSKQARSVIDGLPADVITMNQATDIDALADNGGLVPKDWATRLPNNSAPFTSATVFIVRKGNPKALKDWPDLLKDGVQVVVPNPKTSGNGRYTYLSAWGYVLKNGGDEKQGQGIRRQAVQAGTGARHRRPRRHHYLHAEPDRRRTGDLRERSRDDRPRIRPRRLRGGLPERVRRGRAPVAVVDKVVEKKGSRAQAEAYLKYLWSDEGQTIAANNYLRPRNPEILAKFADRFPKVDFFSVERTFGDWRSVQKTHFIDGGVFDQIYSPN